ncbi:TPA: hypothetical protein P2R00_004448 [Aeromonas veronii]|uniref:hypothetical protein n=1 Tax=Aeromonas enteropelogenes TaxID=29489 RepID=UPI003BA346BB|nr:hypothetical protein [Aeromonas veronii]
MVLVFSFFALTALSLAAWWRVIVSNRDLRKVDYGMAMALFIAMCAVSLLVFYFAPLYGSWVWLLGFVSINGLAIQAISYLFGFSWGGEVLIYGESV